MVSSDRVTAVSTANLVRIDLVTESPIVGAMVVLIVFFWHFVAALFKSRSRLEAENAALRLLVARRQGVAVATRDGGIHRSFFSYAPRRA